MVSLRIIVSFLYSLSTPPPSLLKIGMIKIMREMVWDADKIRMALLLYIAGLLLLAVFAVL